MNSSESAANGNANGEIILKTEEYDIDGPTPSAFIKSVTSFASQSRLINVNFNNNLTVNCNNNSNSLSPKLEAYCPTTSSSSSPIPLDRMPIPTSAEMQATVGTTAGQHSTSPSLPTPQAGSLPQLPNGASNEQILSNRRMTSILGGYGLVPPGILGPLDHYRLQLYSYAMNVERLRGCGASQQYPGPLYSSGYPGTTGGPVSNGPYAPTRFALSMGLFPNRMFQPEEPKPQHSYIGLIAMAILSSPESKLVLSDIYQYILDNYPYFRTRGPGWRNSIRHNLSLNDCFIKAGRSANGKGHYWAIHPANLDDFRKGDFRRRKAQRKVRKHMGLAVDDEGTDSPSPPPLAVTPPPMVPPPHSSVLLVGSPYGNHHHSNHQHFPNPLSSVVIGGGPNETSATTTTAAGVIANLYSQTRKRQFDVASLLAPDDTPAGYNHQPQLPYKGHHHHLPMLGKQRISHLNEEEDIDVVASDVDEEQEQILHVEEEPYYHRHSNNHHHNHHHQHQQQQHQNQPQQQDGNSPHSSFAPPSPVSQHKTSSELPSQQLSNTNPTNWQDLMQHWPNEFGTAAAAAAMDPRIFGRYYSQYVAAAAARRVAGVFPPAAVAAAAAAAVIGQNQHSGTKQMQQQQQSSTMQQKQQQQSYEC